MIRLILYPFAWVYGIITSLRNRLYDLQIITSTEFDVPVISIGNITVGGTGKTPHVEYLINLLKDKFEVVTLSRGYKRKTKGFRIVEAGSSIREAGDEPLQVKNKFPGITVAVCENRVKGTEQVLKDGGKKPDVVLLDDAFQHRRITPGINILLIDYNRQISKDKLLPAGRLRESIHQMKRANLIIFTKCPDEITPIMKRILSKDIKLKPYQQLFFTAYTYGNLKPVFNVNSDEIKTDQAEKYNMLIVTGIASPQPVYNHLKKYSVSMETIAFPDHYNFSEKDIKLLSEKFTKMDPENRIIITTEKDAMRFRENESVTEEMKEAFYFLPVEVKFLENDEKEFNKKILNYVGENKSNRELHQRKNKSYS